MRLSDKDCELQEYKDSVQLERHHFYGWCLDVSRLWHVFLPSRLSDRDYWYEYSFLLAYEVKREVPWDTYDDFDLVASSIKWDQAFNCFTALDEFGVAKVGDYTFLNPGWLYMADSYEKILKQIVFEWRHDKHLVGY